MISKALPRSSIKTTSSTTTMSRRKRAMPLTWKIVFVVVIVVIEHV
jgi:hypothetical protein